MDESKLMTAQETAEYLRIQRKFVYVLVQRGELECYRVGKKNELRISKEQIDKFLANHRNLRDES